jgi:hypothetical protein
MNPWLCSVVLSLFSQHYQNFKWRTLWSRQVHNISPTTTTTTTKSNERGSCYTVNGVQTTMDMFFSLAALGRAVIPSLIPPLSRLTPLSRTASGGNYPSLRTDIDSDWRWSRPFTEEQSHVCNTYSMSTYNYQSSQTMSPSQELHFFDLKKRSLLHYPTTPLYRRHSLL